MDRSLEILTSLWNLPELKAIIMNLTLNQVPSKLKRAELVDMVKSYGAIEVQVVQDGMQLEVEPPPPPATLVVEEALVPSSGACYVSEADGYACMGH